MEITVTALQQNSTPDYLSHLIPPSVQTTTIHPPSNGDDKMAPFCIDHPLIETPVSILRLENRIV